MHALLVVSFTNVVHDDSEIRAFCMVADTSTGTYDVSMSCKREDCGRVPDGLAPNGLQWVA